MKLTLILMTLATAAFASSMSEIDLMTREEITNYFEEHGTQIDEITVHGLATPHDTALCDFEVSVTVHYQSRNRQVTEACYVCFENLSSNSGRVTVDPVMSYCIE